MKVTFLEAHEPLTKSFDLDDQGNLVKSSYPVVKSFKSHTAEVADTKSFYTQLAQHAAKGRSLLKGQLQRPLEWESRAGSTNAHSETEYICFDLDLDLGFSTPEDFVAHLAKHYPQYYDVSYIAQMSGSYMVHVPTPLKCHIFFMCEPIAAPMLKQHLMDINLKLFPERLKLTKTNNALSWGVDITACQNDKLIYIAPPEINDSKIKDLCSFPRIKLVQGKVDYVKASHINIPSAESLKTQANNLINTLRETAGLPKRAKFEMKFQGSQAYLPTKEAASITGMKVDRGFVYFNFNGGDSWAYYHPEGRPEFIYNFKGEPTYLTKELLPDYWTECRSQEATNKQFEKTLTEAQNQGKRICLAFRNFRESRYMNGYYDPNTKSLDLNYCSREQLADFLQSNGLPVPEFYPDWNVIYDPTVPLNPYNPIDITNRTLNLFVPSKYMLNPPSALTKKVKQCPPLIHRVLMSLMGNDQALVDHWHNYAAYILRERKKTRTAWVFQGIEGTGKGLLFYKIMQPLLGEQNAQMVQFQELEERYTAAFEHLLWCVVDEADMSEHPKKAMIMSNLKNQITEPMLRIRRMHSNAYTAPNFTNYSFHSNNKREPVVISDSNRRFNVAPFQMFPLGFTKKEAEEDIAKELDDYANFLYNLKIDYIAVSVPIRNEAMQLAIENSRSSIDMIADIIKSGDIQALWDSLPHDPNALDIQMSVRYQSYKNVLEDIVRTRRAKLHRDEILAIFQFNIGNIPTSPAKFTRFCGHHGLDIRPVNIDCKTVRGIDIGKWEAPEEWWEEKTKEIETPSLKLVAKEA
jgi:hypothetical protein